MIFRRQARIGRPRAWWVVSVVVAVAVLSAACGGSGDDDASDGGAPSFGDLAPGAPEPSPAFDVAEMSMDGDEGRVTIDIQVAETSEQQQIGLMGRESLPDNSGMLFIFPGEQQSGFWMKDTLIPLSIAFIGTDRKIVDILDMEPCEEEPCEIYTPNFAYVWALEVNKGMFDEWGVSEGDSTKLLRE